MATPPVPRDILSYTVEGFNKPPPQLVNNGVAKMLSEVDISHIWVPKWNHYKNFVGAVNRKNSRPIDRLHMEALWMDALWKRYTVYDPRSKKARRDQDTFQMCMWQKWDFVYHGFNVRDDRPDAPKIESDRHDTKLERALLKFRSKPHKSVKRTKAWTEDYWVNKKKKFPESNIERPGEKPSGDMVSTINVHADVERSMGDMTTKDAERDARKLCRAMRKLGVDKKERRKKKSGVRKLRKALEKFEIGKQGEIEDEECGDVEQSGSMVGIER
ncbi:hypothetical protein M7I_7193 [Glarea lozoyensis 74030]|uniref:Uncharacterized protein n=1 Tax=Glarea lozoyensis (strain ATCC 74030 / MF5533) TaxID=1104152 RepID=H0EWM3_GLAL7|nr:hypothetical protein M7I_7193 [Glarea lozoyensis 74030]